MLSKVLSLGLSGVNGYEVQTECYIGTGLPAFDLVGLPDASVKEARERVRAAIKNCGFRFPVSRIIVNLAPAGTKKSGTLYDLPILLSILAASEQVKLPKKRCAFLGELSLEGALRAVPGVLPMALAAKRLGYEELYVPEDNAASCCSGPGKPCVPLSTDAMKGCAYYEQEKKSRCDRAWPCGRARRVCTGCTGHSPQYAASQGTIKNRSDRRL